MIVSWFVGRGLADQSGLFCTDCKNSFSADFSFFFSNFNDFLNGKKGDKLVFCPYCGVSSFYPALDLNTASSNYLKYKEFIR